MPSSDSLFPMPSSTPSATHTRLFAHLGGASWLYWLCQLGGWGTLWLLSVVEIPDDPSSIVYPFSRFLTDAWFYGTAFALTHLWRTVIRHYGWHLMSMRMWLPRMLFGALTLTVLHLALKVVPCVLNPLRVAPGPALAVIATFALLDVVQFFVWSAFYFGYHAQQQLHELQIKHLEQQGATRDAMLQALRAQVNPHFFFNSLNTLRHLIDEDPTKARTMVTQLAQVFRSSLNQSDQVLVTLRDEWATVAAYLAIEAARFEERLRVTYRIEPDALDRLLPPFLLQTLVENAIKFGVSPNEGGGDVHIACEVLDRTLQLQVRNSGALASGDASSTGIGLANARERLRLLFGEAASLTLGESDHQVIATVRLPATP